MVGILAARVPGDPHQVVQIFFCRDRVIDAEHSPAQYIRRPVDHETHLGSAAAMPANRRRRSE